MSANYVGLMAKYPELGKVKTRLAESTGSESALAIYKELLENCVSRCSPKKDEFSLIPFITPEEKVDNFKREYPDFESFLPQTGSGLGEKMINALTCLKQAFNSEKVILIGADIPELNADLICRGFEMLNFADIVLGPSSDGGYYLVGMKKIERTIFKDITYGTDTVLEQTLNKIRDSQLSYSLLPELSDLDTIEDLELFPAFKRLLQ